MNPIKEIRMNKNLNLNEAAKLLDSNSYAITTVEKGICGKTAYLTIIRKMSLAFDDIDDVKLIKKYQDWLSENDITVKK